eukprot:1137145-Pelagomonas_calceolata.AAC.2
MGIALVEDPTQKLVGSFCPLLPHGPMLLVLLSTADSWSNVAGPSVHCCLVEQQACQGTPFLHFFHFFINGSTVIKIKAKCC